MWAGVLLKYMTVMWRDHQPSWKALEIQWSQDACDRQGLRDWQQPWGWREHRSWREPWGVLEIWGCQEPCG